MDFSQDVVVRAEEIREVICKLDDNKSCGPDAIFAGHLTHANLRLVPLLEICTWSPSALYDCCLIGACHKR